MRTHSRVPPPLFLDVPLLCSFYMIIKLLYLYISNKRELLRARIKIDENRKVLVRMLAVQNEFLLNLFKPWEKFHKR